MKTFLTFFLLLTLSFLSVQKVQAQNPDATFQAVTAALQKGDAQALSEHFNTTVEVVIPGNDASYSAQQAQFVLKDFFTRYPVSGFQRVHGGNSGATWYSTGVYNSAKGSFDTNIFVKKVGEKFLITAIRFEAE